MKSFFKPAVLASIALLSLLSSCSGSSDEIAPGATLYTVRDLMAEQPKETLQAVSEIGYVNIEATNYENGKFYGMEPKAFKSYLESLGMVPLSVHQGAVTLDNADQMITDSKAAGFKYFVIPVPPMGHFSYDPQTMTLSMSDEVEEVTDIINIVGKKCKAAGMQLLYHNHDFEFKPNANGIVPMDYFLENTDPEEVNFQMDLYWVTRAGADPLEYFEKYPGRFKIWHVKDMDEQGRFAPVGTGTIDFKRILEAKEQAGMEYYIVEQDMTFDGMDPMQAIRTSYENLADIGFRKAE